jgi:hypothetical protein
MRRLRLLAVLCSVLALLPLTATQAAKRPAFKPLRVHGQPVRAIGITELRQFSALSVPDLNRIAADGFNTVTIYAYRFMTSASANSQHVGQFTEPDASLATTIDAAHRAGLAVELIPTIWVGEGVGALYWRGAIHPTDRNAWFDSYRAMVTHYADLATQHGVELYGVGSEMRSLENETSQWQHTITAARSHYKGPITYFTIVDSAPDIAWWDRVDYPGISAYLSLSSNASPGYDELVKAWRTVHLPRLRAVAARVGRPLQLAEIGYASTENAATHPEQGASGARDEALQATLYRALLDTAVRDASVDGLSLWRWSAYQQGPVDTGFSPKGKQAECLLAQRWAPAGPSAAQCVSLGRVLR